MPTDPLYIANPDQALIVATLREKLEGVHHTSDKHTFTLRMPGGMDAHIALVVPLQCPACLYDPTAPLEKSWEVLTRDEWVQALPYPWAELQVGALDEIIDTLLEYGVTKDGRFMTCVGKHGERHCFLTSARMLCFLHVGPTGE